AGRLASRAVLRIGAGLVTWCTPASAPEREPEIMHHDVREGLPERPTVLVVGPGLGLDDAAREALDLALADGRPLVLDADALNALAARDMAANAEGHVVTPHPAEAGRLLGSSAKEVEADRLSAAEALVGLTRAVVVLKGARTIVAAPGEPAVLFERPAPALAAGGTGDVLAGAIAGLMAQGLAPRDAALLAVFCHAEAGRATGLDQADRGVLASEVADALPAAMAHLTTGWT
ncbi:MAG: NAD(P)H-hydrate dehydratase, partial [Myxococcales bacterium]|nr:NAD(P)H-hydrate dehydratase [Myxococcales bacterium]